MVLGGLRFLQSKVREALDEVVELSAVDLATAILVELVVTLLEVILVPGLELVRRLHDIHDELAQVVLRDDHLIIFVHRVIGVVLSENLVAKFLHLALHLAVG